MKTVRISFMALIALFLSFSAQKGMAALDTKVPQEMATAWLALVDAEKYPEAWKGFSSMFKEKMTQEKWEEQVKSARAMFGKFESRKVKNASPVKSLPGAPDGDYVVIQYETSFEKKKSAIETVTVLLEKDGKWGVVGYFIK